MNPAISLIINLTITNVCCPQPQLCENTGGVLTRNCSETVKPLEYTVKPPPHTEEAAKSSEHTGEAAKPLPHTEEAIQPSPHSEKAAKPSQHSEEAAKPSEHSEKATKPSQDTREAAKPSEYPEDIVTRNCSETLKPWEYPGGVFKIDIPKSEPFDVYRIKNPEGGPEWTIIQRRMDGSENFYRNWKEYESGFGNVNGEYFLGLKKIHQLTNIEPNELWVELTDYQNETRYAKYGIFSIGNATQKYILDVGNFSGCAGDSMKYHNGMMFSTYDNDHKECSKRYKSGWWMNACYRSDLDGIYFHKNEKTYFGALGIKWISWDKTNENRNNASLKYAHMAIRPVRLSSRRDSKTA